MGNAQAADKRKSIRRQASSIDIPPKEIKNTPNNSTPTPKIEGNFIELFRNVLHLTYEKKRDLLEIRRG